MLRVIRASSLVRYSIGITGLAVALLFLWPGLVQNLFAVGNGSEFFMTHEHCYLGINSLVVMHFSSDLLIGLSYVAISLTLTYLVYRARRDMPFHWVFLAFGLFIVACGSTHFIEVWTTFNAPVYWFAGYLKLITAVASVATALVLPPLVPRTLALVQAAKLSDVRREELETANRELAEVYGKIKELDELKTQFFSNVSHELRTPLALILAPAQKLLSSEELNHTQRQSLETIDRNARALLKHVNDLLDISKMEAGKMKLVYTEIDLAQLVRLAAAYFESFAAERRINFSLDVPAALRAEGDAEKLQRVLINLFSNAFKFTPDGGEIRCALREAESGRAIIEVRDSGPGIAPELREAVFERFRQAEGGASRRFGGTGLGLSIAKEFVELHGGRISVGDAPEGGAQFNLDLPRAAAAGVEVASRPLSEASEVMREAAEQALGAIETEQMQLGIRQQQPEDAEASAENGQQSAPPSRRREDDETERSAARPSVADLSLAPLVLVVEDNAEMNRFVADELRGDYRVATAFNGHEGIEQALALRPDLILSDVMMPEMSGDEFVRELRTHSELADVPVCMLTAKADEALRVQLLRAGVQDYLMKPFVSEELRARVENLIVMKRTRAALQRELDSQHHDLLKLADEVSLRRRGMEAALAAQRQSNETLAAIIHASPLGIVTLDPNGMVRTWNRAAERIYGWSEREVIGRELPTVPADKLEEMRLNHRAAVEGRAFNAFETERWRKDGVMIHVSISTAPLRDAAGRTSGVVALVEDITERKRVEEALRNSEERFRLLVEGVKDYAIFMLDTGGHVISWNQGAERIKGYRADEIIGKHFSIFYTDKDLRSGSLERELQIAQTEGRYEEVGLRVRRDGTRFWANVVLTALRDETGVLRGYAKVTRDITERKNAEEARRFLGDATTMLASSLDYELTLESVARLALPYVADYCLVHLLENDSTIRRMVVAHQDPAREAAWREMQRHFPIDLNTPHTISKVLRTGQPEMYREVSDELLTTEIKNPGEIRMLKSFDIKSVMIVPLIARGRTLGAISFLIVESERVYGDEDLRLAAELARRAAFAIDNARLYQRAQETNRVKDEFLATLSHELRTPLTPIIGWVHMMGTGNLAVADLTHGISIIDKNSQALARLINDLLDMSAILSGKMRIDTLPVPLNSVLTEAIETVRPQAARQSIEIEFVPVAGTDEAVISGDRTRLVQVFWNLLTNAVKFSRAGGRVRVACESAGAGINVHVEDEGEGIKLEFLPHVFERFRQQDMSTTKMYGGLGIGLALVKSFVEAHGGRVRAASAGAGRGSRFTVYLPLMRADATASTLPSGSAAQLPGESAGACHVLIIEDAPDTLEMLRVTFEVQGFRTSICASAEEALRIAANERFDIIISDIGLPNIDGYELLQRLRRQTPYLRDIPALALTGYAAQKDIDAALAAGFSAHLAKPFDPSRLAAAVDALLKDRESGSSDSVEGGDDS